MLSTPKERVQFLREPDYQSYTMVASLLNLIKRAERAEEKVLISPGNILDEMQRIAHKQFLWQREFFQSNAFTATTTFMGRGNVQRAFPPEKRPFN